LHEQKQAAVSKQELLNQSTDFDGTLYIDGDWIKKGWKKKFETLIGIGLTHLRYKIKYNRRCDLNLDFRQLKA